MTDIIHNILPLLMIFGVGYSARKVRLLTRDNADLLLKIFFYFALPALILLSIPNIPLTVELIYLPIISMSMVLVGMIAALIFRRFLVLPSSSLGVFLIGSMIFNGAFAFPFVFEFYGVQGMALAYLFDFGNAVVSLSIAYYIACRYGSGNRNHLIILKKFLMSPPLLALGTALILNLSGSELPLFIEKFLRILSSMTTPLVMLALGVYFNHRIVLHRPLLTVIGIRMLGGLIFGSTAVVLLGLEGLTRTIVMIMAVCPSAMNTLVYATMEGLDKDFAASIVSYTTLISMVMIPLVILLFH